MRAELFFLWALSSVVHGFSIERRDPPKKDHWKPKTKDPHFFNLKVNDRCDPNRLPIPKTKCPFDGFAIRLEKGIVIATPYNKWWDPKLPTFFVDDDTKLYTVSKDPLQLYVDMSTGAVKYTKVGWVPPSAISENFFHSGNNPLQRVDPSPSFLSWPSTVGHSFDGTWTLCRMGDTGQWQVYVNKDNFDSSGVDKANCEHYRLAAVNANPWKKDKHHKHHGHKWDDKW